jgi:hypothetical protein
MQPALPTMYRRLVAKSTGRSFKEVAEVIEDPLPLPGPNEVCCSAFYSLWLFLLVSMHAVS